MYYGRFVPSSGIKIIANGTGLQFTTKVVALPDTAFAVASFTLDEQLSEAFTLKLEVASHIPDVDFADVLGKVRISGEILLG